MTRERRILHLSTLVIFLALLLFCRMGYWQLIRNPAWDVLEVSEEIAASQDPAENSLNLSDGPTPTPTAKPVQYLLTVTPDSPSADTSPITPLFTPTLKPTSTQTPTSTPTPTPTPTTDVTTITRGTIYDRNGRRLAYDLENGSGNLLRFYTEPSLAHVIGYVSGLRRGIIGIELAYDETLLSIDDTQAFIGSQSLRGNDIYLTIDSRLQRAAAQALQGKAGAIVALDGQSGAILAMASTPAFDPNKILDAAYLHSLENCDGSVACRHALFNRAAQGGYTPGSTWKTVTLMAALDSDQVTPDTLFDFGELLTDENGQIYYVYVVDNFPIRDPNHRERQLNLVRSYAVSANAAFARIGDEMPADVLITYAAQLGFGRETDSVPPIEIDASAARLALNMQDLYTNNLLRASTAIGQGELLVSPLSIALMTTAVVNQGHIPRPHLVQSINSSSGELLVGEVGGFWIEGAVRPETGALVRDMMIEVVRNGSGVRANVSGFVVGGKTGTAQVGGDLPPHAWFIGFIQDNERTIVIAVIVENGGSGARVAAPLFAQVADVAMHHLGEPVEEIISEPVLP